MIGLERDGNAEPCAVLLMNGADGQSAAGIIDGANQSLAEYQKIRHWFVWPEPDFPQDADAKADSFPHP